MLELTDDELILTSPVVYGFSLSDKIWRKPSLDRTNWLDLLTLCYSRIQRQARLAHRLE